MKKEQKALGIDIGGTKILYGIVDQNGNIVSDIQKNQHPKQRVKSTKL